MGPAEHANNILVLIQPALAGPSVDPLNYWQPQWVLWPPVLRDDDGGRLLSLATGADWVGDLEDFRFDPIDGGKAWLSHDFDRQKAVGRFTVRVAEYGVLRTGLLVGKSGATSRNALRLALNGDSSFVQPYRVDAHRWPSGSLMVAEASGWDEVATFEAATTGRVLVVEYPPRPDVPWTRYWLRGRGWQIDSAMLSSSSDSAVVPVQPGSHIPGLIRARMLLPLVTHPERFRSANVSLKDWPGANRFLELCRWDAWPLSAAWFALTAGAVIWGAVLVANERTSRVLPVGLAAVLLSPAVLSVAGVMGRYLGVHQWPVWLIVATICLLAISAGLEVVARRVVPSAHRLLSVYVAGLVSICVCDPVWSFMSPLFTLRPYSVSPVALGAACVYLGGFVAALRGCGSMPTWAGRGACAVFLALGVTAKAWWSHDLGATLFVPAVCLVVGEGWFQRSMLPIFALWPTSLIRLATGRFVWDPAGLLTDASGRYGINASAYVDFLASPATAAFLLLSGAISLFGYKFFFHQLRMAGKLDPRRKALPWLAVSGFAFGLLHPSFLFSAMVVATGAVAALMYDAVLTM